MTINFTRKPGTNRSGDNFTHPEVYAVWQKGQIIPGYDSQIYRRDKCGAVMEFSQYGKTNSKKGWEIDHIKPVAGGGGDEISNLQPLQWENNRHKSDSFPHYNCLVKQ